MTGSDHLYKRALAVIPGGVNSPVRAFRAVGGDPRFIARARDAHLEDASGARLLDYVMSYGAIILGHADPRVTEAIARAASDGTSFGAPSEGEIDLSERIAEAVPCVEKVRLVSSGTEATMSAIRLARAATSRDKIVKFAGCYHGHSDALLAQAGSGVATLGIPGSPGVTAGAARDTIVASFNAPLEIDVDDIAAVIVEPVAANMGVVPPAPGWLEALRAWCDRTGALLIFDEVITGFRLARGGAQERFGVTPDLVCLGKVIGGGLPSGAFGGRAALMDLLAPDGPVYQAGTLSGNPVAVAAGRAVLDALSDDPPYAMLEQRARKLCDGLTKAAQGSPIRINREGSLFSIFFTGGTVQNYEDARAQDTSAYARFFHAMLDRRIHLAPGAFEAWFLSAAHTDEDIEETIDAAGRAFERVT